MKTILRFTLILLFIMPFFSITATAGGDNGVIPFITNKNATVNISDTVKTIMLDEFDWYGMYISSNDTLQTDIYVQYTATGTGKYVQYQDSVLITNAAGGIKFITLRSPKVETIPFGADQMRVIVARRNYTQASVGKFSFGIQAYPYKRYKSKN